MSSADITASSAREYFDDITDSVCGVCERKKPPKAWYIAMSVSLGDAVAAASVFAVRLV